MQRELFIFVAQKFTMTYQIPESFANCLGGLQRVVGIKNLSLKLEIQGDNQLNEVHSSCTVNWATPNKRYSTIELDA